LRRWFTRKLRESAVGRYTVSEECEVDLVRYPDIRVEKPGLCAVSIEVKWADSWTIAELLERLENQLVGTYLRPHSLRFGIFLLGFIARKRSWEQSDGPNLSFHEVVELLQRRATQLCNERPGELGLEVIGMDFTNPELP
jgi:hypothetical protein